MPLELLKRALRKAKDVLVGAQESSDTSAPDKVTLSVDLRPKQDSKKYEILDITADGESSSDSDDSSYDMYGKSAGESSSGSISKIDEFRGASLLYSGSLHSTQTNPQDSSLDSASDFNENPPMTSNRMMAVDKNALQTTLYHFVDLGVNCICFKKCTGYFPHYKLFLHVKLRSSFNEVLKETPNEMPKTSSMTVSEIMVFMLNVAQGLVSPLIEIPHREEEALPAHVMRSRFINRLRFRLYFKYYPSASGQDIAIDINEMTVFKPWTDIINKDTIEEYLTQVQKDKLSFADMLNIHQFQKFCEFGYGIKICKGDYETEVVQHEELKECWSPSSMYEPDPKAHPFNFTDMIRASSDKNITEDRRSKSLTRGTDYSIQTQFTTSLDVSSRCVDVSQGEEPVPNQPPLKTEDQALSTIENGDYMTTWGTPKDEMQSHRDNLSRMGNITEEDELLSHQMGNVQEFTFPDSSLNTSSCNVMGDSIKERQTLSDSQRSGMQLKLNVDTEYNSFEEETGTSYTETYEFTDGKKYNIHESMRVIVQREILKETMKTEQDEEIKIYLFDLKDVDLFTVLGKIVRAQYIGVSTFAPRICELALQEEYVKRITSTHVVRLSLIVSALDNIPERATNIAQICETSLPICVLSSDCLYQIYKDIPHLFCDVPLYLRCKASHNILFKRLLVDLVKRKFDNEDEPNDMGLSPTQYSVIQNDIKCGTWKTVMSVNQNGGEYGTILTSQMAHIRKQFLDYNLSCCIKLCKIKEIIRYGLGTALRNMSRRMLLYKILYPHLYYRYIIRKISKYTGSSKNMTTISNIYKTTIQAFDVEQSKTMYMTENVISGMHLTDILFAEAMYQHKLKAKIHHHTKSKEHIPKLVEYDNTLKLFNALLATESLYCKITETRETTK